MANLFRCGNESLNDFMLSSSYKMIYCNTWESRGSSRTYTFDSEYKIAIIVSAAGRNGDTSSNCSAILSSGTFKKVGQKTYWARDKGCSTSCSIGVATNIHKGDKVSMSGYYATIGYIIAIE